MKISASYLKVTNFSQRISIFFIITFGFKGMISLELFVHEIFSAFVLETFFYEYHY